MNENRGLWRGKTTPKRNGEAFDSVWVEGDLIHSVDLCYIHPITNSVKVQEELGRFIVMHEVAPSTLGKCVGFRDKNRILMFEGDVITYKSITGKMWVAKIIYSVNKCRFVQETSSGQTFEIARKYANCYEVIGNIHDNPGLIQKR